MKEGIASIAAEYSADFWSRNTCPNSSIRTLGRPPPTNPSRISVKEAEDRDERATRPCPWGSGQLSYRSCSSGLATQVRLDQNEPVNRHRPSVDVLFDFCRAIREATSWRILTGIWARRGQRFASR